MQKSLQVKITRKQAHFCWRHLDATKKLKGYVRSCVNIKMISFWLYLNSRFFISFVSLLQIHWYRKKWHAYRAPRWGPKVHYVLREHPIEVDTNMTLQEVHSLYQYDPSIVRLQRFQHSVDITPQPTEVQHTHATLCISKCWQQRRTPPQ